MRIQLLTLLLSTTAIQACASLHEEPSQTEHITLDTEADFKPVAFTTVSGLADYQLGSTKGQGEWISCHLKTAKATVLVMHTDRQGYDRARFCTGWHAQAFLSSGYDVLTIHRPGFGASTGAPDFTGATSLAAVTTIVPLALGAAKLPPLAGVWGYGSGATAAALVSKHLKGLKFLVMGGGLYDYEEVLRATTDKATKGDLETIKKLGGDKAIEERSVAYDATGLPPSIAIYHAPNDAVAPTAQAKAFADSLTSSGKYKVSYQLLDSQGHDVPWVYHRHVLEALVKSLAPAS